MAVSYSDMFFDLNASDPADCEEIMLRFRRFLQEAEDYQDAGNLLSACISAGCFRETSNIQYRCGEYIICNWLRFGTVEKIKFLKLLNEKQFSIFPEYVDDRCFGDFCVLIIRMHGSGDKELIPLADGEHLLTDEARHAAYADVKRLVRASLADGMMMAERGCPWFVTPCTHRLVLGNMPALYPLKESDKRDVLSRAYTLLYGKSPRDEDLIL